MEMGKMDSSVITDCNWDFKVVVLKEKDNNSVCLIKKNGTVQSF